MDSMIILPSKPKIVTDEPKSGVFEIEGLHPGYGYTLGNSLRRIILSSLPGSAITSLKIEGAPHEFSTLSGVKEDVIMLILNLKKVRFAWEGNEPQRLSLTAKGQKMVTAGDIETGGLVEILNPNQPIAALSDKNAEISIEMTVEKGLGYLSKEAIRKDRNEIGTIFVDATFTPITKVSYEVENMRVGDRTDYNRLRIAIETDGTLSPKMALEKSIYTMIEQLKAIVGFKEEVFESELSAGQDAEELDAEGKKADGDSLKTRIEDLDLSARTIKALTNEGIRTVGGLARKKEADLSEIAGLGDKGIAEIIQALSNLGISLK